MKIKQEVGKDKETFLKQQLQLEEIEGSSGRHKAYAYMTELEIQEVQRETWEHNYHKSISTKNSRSIRQGCPHSAYLLNI